MKKPIPLLASLLLLLVIFMAACGPSAPAMTEVLNFEVPAATEPPAMGFDQAPAAEPASGAPEAEKSTLPEVAVYDTGAGVQALAAPRMVIKNAEVRLLVADTDAAIDRATQVVGDVGGYIISSRIWYADYYGQNLKYATITIGVPVDQFETALRRLRGLAVRVVDENASGEDVTDQYVDLESQLVNLEATRDRIKSFLEDAKTVDEALRINQQLSEIERQIEEIKGRMNYLNDRSSFSTITINLEPEFPEITPTPTVTPTPTATPEPWKPGETFDSAKKTVVSAYQGITEFLIWFFVVIVPLLAPPALILWLVWRFTRRKPKSGA
ncbi:MAG: DUF4349 domain-containing protein [Chloroflexota bacterium]